MRAFGKVAGFAGVIFGLSLPVAGQSVYKCTNENGSTVFSQRPCSDEAEVIDVAPTNGSAPPSAEAGEIYRNAARDRRIDQINKNYEKEIRDIDRGSCQRAKGLVTSAKERWNSAKRSGYTPDQQRYYQQLIKDRERRAAERC